MQVLNLNQVTDLFETAIEVKPARHTGAAQITTGVMRGGVMFMLVDTAHDEYLLVTGDDFDPVSVLMEELTEEASS